MPKPKKRTVCPHHTAITAAEELSLTEDGLDFGRYSEVVDGLEHNLNALDLVTASAEQYLGPGDADSSKEESCPQASYSTSANIEVRETASNIHIGASVLMAGQVIKVQVGHVEAPNKLWLRPVGPALCDLLKNMCAYYQSPGEIRQKVTVPEVGMICAVQQSLNNQFIRAYVVSVPEVGNSEVGVFFVDDGNCQTLPANKLWYLPPMFTRLPFQAMPCALSEVYWTAEASEQVLQVVNSDMFSCVVLDNQNLNVPLVDLYFSNQEYALGAGDTSGRNLTDILIHRGIAYPAAVENTREVHQQSEGVPCDEGVKGQYTQSAASDVLECEISAGKVCQDSEQKKSKTCEQVTVCDEGSNLGDLLVNSVNLSGDSPPRTASSGQRTEHSLPKTGSSEPKTEDNPPRSGDNSPASGDSRQGTEHSLPKTGSSEPKTEDNPPRSGDNPPGSGDSPPRTASSGQRTEHSLPKTGSSEPKTEDNPPRSGDNSPASGDSRQGTEHSLPKTGSSEPKTEDNPPRSGDNPPGSGDSPPRTASSGQRTEHSLPKTGSSEPKTEDNQPRSGDNPPGSGDSRQGTEHSLSKTGSSESKTEDNPPGSGDNPPRPGDSRQGTEHSLPKTGPSEPKTEDNQPRSGDNPPGSEDSRQGTEHSLPKTEDNPPGSGDNPPRSGNNPPMTGSGQMAGDNPPNAVEDVHNTLSNTMDADLPVNDSTTKSLQESRKNSPIHEEFSSLIQKLSPIFFNHPTVLLANIISPSEFFVHCVTEVTAQTLQVVEDCLEKYLSVLEQRKLPAHCSVSDLSFGSLCCGRYTKDNKLYRAMVIEITPEGTTKDSKNGEILITYLDFGNTESLPLSRLFPLPKECADLQAIPPAAVRCRLACISPPVSNNPSISANQIFSDNWENEAIQEFFLLTGYEKPFKMFILPYNPEGNMSNVVPDNDDPVPVILVDESRLCINSELVEKGVACFVKPRPEVDDRYTQGKVVVCGSAGDETDLYASLPEEFSWVGVEVTAILNPKHFYVIVHWDDLTLPESTDSYSNPKDALLEELKKDMTSHYNANLFHDNSTLLPAIGEIVAVRFKDDMWYRARVISWETEDSVKVFFLDYGYTVNLSLSHLRPMELNFLQIPLQAIECSLEGVEPVSGQKWSKEAINCFANLAFGKALAAFVSSRCDDTSRLELMLFNTTTRNHTSIEEELCSAGFARAACDT